MASHQLPKIGECSQPLLQRESLSPFLRKAAALTTIGSLFFPVAGCDQQASGQASVAPQTASPQPEFPKVSPFTSISFTPRDGSLPEISVTLDGSETRYSLIAIDGIPVESLWRTAYERLPTDPAKRIAEDLPQILFYARLGQGLPEKDFSMMSLTLRDPETQAEITREAAATAENRKKIWNARKPQREDAPRAVDLRRNELIAAGALSPLARESAPESGAELMDAALMREDLKFLTRYLSEASAFFARGDREKLFLERVAQIDSELSGLESSAGTRTAREWTLTLHSLIRDLGDGHSEVSGTKSEKILFPGFSPCLFVEADGKVAAIVESREGLFAPGYPFVESINGISLKEWCTVAEQYVVAGSPALITSRSLRMLRFLGELGTVLGVDVSKPLVMELSNEAGEKTRVEFVLQRDKPEYGMWPRRGEDAENLYTQTLEGNIAYLRVGSMQGSDLAEKVRSFMNSSSARDSRGLIIDVRGNSGGNRGALIALYPYLHGEDNPPRVANAVRVRGSRADFSSVEDSLSGRYLFRADAEPLTQEERSAAQSFAASFAPEWSPEEDKFGPWYYLVLSNAGAAYHYQKPVVVLINHDCFSATDVFVSAVGPLDNVTTMGTATGGGSGRSREFTLPSGIEVTLSTMASFQADGRTFDGNGIVPEIPLETPVSVWLQGEGEDVQVKAARSWILSRP